MLLPLPPPTSVRLRDLDLAPLIQEWGTPQKDRSVVGNPLSVGGQRLTHGVGAHAASRLDLRLGGRATHFTARVGVDDGAAPAGSVRFRVYADGTLRADSGILRRGEAPKTLEVPLKGVNLLSLRTTDAGDGIDHDHANWGEALVVTNAPTLIKPVPFARGADPELAPVDTRTTRINGPALLGGTPGRPFLYRVPVSGRRPLRIVAEGLPTGLTIASDGTITGTVPTGEHKIRLRASGPGGTHARTVVLNADGNPLPTPLLGWNSWYAHFLEVDASGVRKAARAMVDSGLASFGFRYINVDDGWEAEERTPEGEIRTNAKFPDMKGLVDEIHGLGLRAGIYSSPGPKTCGQYLGSYGHEGQDARTWAGWGFDLIKYDWCSYGGIAPNPTPLAEHQKPYRLMQSELAKLDRDIALSLCQYGMADVRSWGRDVGGSLWRTTGDITDSWGSMVAIGFENGGLGAMRGDDPDMLMVGNLLTTGKVLPSRLTKNEQTTQMSLWALRGAPLLLSCDLATLDEFTLRLLMNPEVLDMDQDLSAPGRRIAGADGVEVWRRDLADGTYALALFNRGLGVERIASTLGAWLPQTLVAYESVKVRDLWTRRDLRAMPKTLTIPSHGVRLFRVTAR